MRKVVLYLISFVFVANTVVVSAAMKPCMQNFNHDSVQAESPLVSEEHCQSQASQNQDKHCFDACFCPAYSANHIPIIESDRFNALTYKDARITKLTALLISIPFSPLYRPPIQVS